MMTNVRIEYDPYHQNTSSPERGGLKISSPVTGETLHLTWIVIDGEQMYHVDRSGDGKRTTSNQLSSALLWLTAELCMLLSRHAVAVTLNQTKLLADDTTASDPPPRRRTTQLGELITRDLSSCGRFPQDKDGFHRSDVRKVTITLPGAAPLVIPTDARVDIEFN
jgi:hypothetical protein